MRTPAFTPRRLGLIVLSLATTGVLTGTAAAQAVDPPGFAPVTLKGTQVIRLNVLCFDHEVGSMLPGPCRGEVMFHDVGGREIKTGRYELEPGQTMFLQLAIPALTAAGDPIRRVTIIPCVFPDPGGVAVPSVEVFDREVGRAIVFANPAAARMTEFSNSPVNPDTLVGFDPQPDPPVFGLATVRADQSMRLNVFCFGHAINGFEPQACKGTVMFHDAAGNVLRRGTYSLEPGQSRSFEFLPPAARSGATLAGIVPCIVPDPGGPAVPSVEVMDTDGNVVLNLQPAAARASRFVQALVR